MLSLVAVCLLNDSACPLPPPSVWFPFLHLSPHFMHHNTSHHILKMTDTFLSPHDIVFDTTIWQFYLLSCNQEVKLLDPHKHINLACLSVMGTLTQAMGRTCNHHTAELRSLLLRGNSANQWATMLHWWAHISHMYPGIFYKNSSFVMHSCCRNLKILQSVKILHIRNEWWW